MFVLEDKRSLIMKQFQAYLMNLLALLWALHHLRVVIIQYINDGLKQPKSRCLVVGLDK